MVGYLLFKPTGKFKQKAREMTPARDALLFLLIFGIQLCSSHGNDQLSYDFYNKSCPGIERLVRETIAPLFVAPAALLRLMFHDYQVQVCDASILINSNSNIGYSLDNMTREMASGKNFGIRGSRIIEQLKSVAETQCPGAVTCADLLVLAARDAVLSGGSAMKALLGRRDAHTSSLQLADALLPPPTLGVDGMLKMFSAIDMDVPESVAILGSHTLGVTQCVNILKQPGSSSEVVPPMNLVGMGYQQFVKASCGAARLRAAASSSFFTNDKTSLVFDNQYFRDTAVGRGLLRIDGEMTTHPITEPFVALFAVDQDEFFRYFASAFAKLSTWGVLTGDRGQVHNRCNGNGD